MAVSFPGRRYFCNDEELKAQGTDAVYPWGLSSGGPPSMASVSGLKWLECKVYGTAANSLSSLSMPLDDERDEIYVRARIWHDYPNPSGSDYRYVGMLALLFGSAAVAEVRIAGQSVPVTESLAKGSTAQVWSSNYLAKQTAADVIIRYKRSTGNNGILQTWVKVSGSWMLVVNQSNHANTARIDEIQCRCVPESAILAASGDKIVRYRDVRWDDNLAALQAEPHFGGVEFGTPGSPPGSDKTISVPLIYRFDRGFYGPDATQAQFERRLDGCTPSDVGSAKTLTPDAANQEVVFAEDSDLNPLEDGYEWRAHITGNNSFEIWTDWSTTPLPSAADGDAGVLNITFDSCARLFDTKFCPHRVNAITLQKAPFLHLRLEDTFYGGLYAGFGYVLDTAEKMWQGLRANMLWDVGGQKLYRGAGAYIGTGDQLFAGSNDLATMRAEWQIVAAKYVLKRNLRPIAGGNGAYIVTAKALIICPDCYTQSIPPPTSPGPPTMLGETQLADVKTILENFTKPIVVFACGAIATRSYGQPGTNTGWARYSEWLDELDDILDHFATENPNGRMYILSGNSHTCAVLRDNAWPANVVEIISSPVSNEMRLADVAFDLESEDTDFIFHEEVPNPVPDPLPPIFRAAHLQIDETADPPTVEVTIYDENDGVIYNDQ